MTPTPILEVKNLKKYFTTKSNWLGRSPEVLKAVDDISFTIQKGQTLGLVGESGCGKSTVARTIIQLYRPTDGEIWFEGKKLSETTSVKELRRALQMIFQDPYASLNPRFTVEQIIKEPLLVHGLAEGEEQERTAALLELVGLNPSYLSRYPHEFSGGQRQRIGIARALATDPSVILCDEPISALDVSIQAQIVNLLEKLQETLQLSYLFIAHDLAMVRHISDQVAVMYLGKIVETAPSRELYDHPAHPYTQALLAAVPRFAVSSAPTELQRLKGETPSPLAPPPGCRFHPRCPHALAQCATQEPPLREISGGHFAACHLY